MRGVLERLVVAQLRRDLRRIDWIGELPRLPVDRPLVMYANHQAFYDGLVLGFLARRVLGREPCVWMEEHDRLPAAGWLGALPFPPADPQRRAATIRETLARMRRHANLAFIYFPEGRLHPFEEELLDFPADVFSRLERVFPPCLWWPVAVRISSWNSARPVATLTGGRVEPRPGGVERERLAELRDRLLAHQEGKRHTLLEGRPGPDERWAWASRFFGRPSP